MIEIRGLKKDFASRRGTVHAVNGVDLSIPTGKIVGLVGESGSGKTTVGRMLLRLVEPTAGAIEVDGTNIVGLPAKAMVLYRKRLQMIFQDPYSSLNPRMRISESISEGLALYARAEGRVSEDTCEALLEQVGLSAEHAGRYPHEFSGGQRQRVGIARALASSPDLVVADEPVSALDVSVQAQILELLIGLKKRRSLTMLFISHDLEVVEYISDEVVIMYLGKVMECGPTKDVYARPLHPYTRALLSSTPIPIPGQAKRRPSLVGEIPSPLALPSGCVFRTRCRYADDACARAVPDFRDFGSERKIACIRAEEIENDTAHETPVAGALAWK